MTNNNITRSAIYLEMAQAIHSELESFVDRGDIAHFRECEVIYEFTDLDARKEFALKIGTIVGDVGGKYGLSDNAKLFLTEHFQLKVASNNLTKCMLEHLCFSPVGVIPTALNILIYSHITHAYVDADVNTLDFAEHFQCYMSAINEIIDQPIPKTVQRSLYQRQKANSERFNQSLFAQVYQMHSKAHSSKEINHTFLWVKPERIITNPVEDEKQLRADFSKVYGELVTYILRQPNFKEVTGKALQLFNAGNGYGFLHTTLATFLQYPLFIFMSARDHSEAAQRLGEGFFAYLFAVFAPSLTLEETPNSYVAHLVPVMSLDEMSKKVSLTYLAGILDWYRSLCFGAEYFDRLTAFNCYDYHEGFIKAIFPKGFKTMVEAKPVEMKAMVWSAYERGLELTDKRSKKQEKHGGSKDSISKTEEQQPAFVS